MTENTPGTRPDPELPGEGDANQLPQEDTLEDRNVDDLLDEGYSPPEKPSAAAEQTEEELNEPDTIAEREKQTTPEAWEQGGATSSSKRSGRLSEDDEADSKEQDVTAEDVGISGGAASAEEAAMHDVDDEDLPGAVDDGLDRD